MKTPVLEAAMRAGMNGDVVAALKVAVPREPTEAMIDALAQAIFDAAGKHGRREPSKPWEKYRAIAVAAYPAQPIWRELWGDEDERAD